MGVSPMNAFQNAGGLPRQDPAILLHIRAEGARRRIQRVKAVNELQNPENFPAAVQKGQG